MIKIVHIGLPFTGLGTIPLNYYRNINNKRLETILTGGKDELPDLFTKKQ